MGNGVRWRAALAVAAAGALAVAAAIAAPASAATHLLVISGLGGEESYSTSFHDWSTSLIASAVATGIPADNVVYLAEDPARDSERIDGDSRKETIEATLQKMGAAAGAQGELWLVIFGHGSARGDETTVNLPGPDLSGGELAAILDRLPVEEGGDRERLERERRLRARPVGARPGDRHRHPGRHREARARVRRLLQRRVRRQPGRRRQGPARVAARGLRLRSASRSRARSRTMGGW